MRRRAAPVYLTEEETTIPAKDQMARIAEATDILLKIMQRMGSARIDAARKGLRPSLFSAMNRAKAGGRERRIIRWQYDAKPRRRDTRATSVNRKSRHLIRRTCAGGRTVLLRRDAKISPRSDHRKKVQKVP